MTVSTVSARAFREDAGLAARWVAIGAGLCLTVIFGTTYATSSDMTEGMVGLFAITVLLVATFAPFGFASVLAWLLFVRGSPRLRSSRILEFLSLVGLALASSMGWLLASGVLIAVKERDTAKLLSAFERALPWPEGLLPYAVSTILFVVVPRILLRQRLKLTI